MQENTITPELLAQVDEAIIGAELGTSNLYLRYVIFEGPSYSFKVLNDPERLVRFRKSLERARSIARAKPWTPQKVRRQVAYHNSVRGLREARTRLANDDYYKYFKPSLG